MSVLPTERPTEEAVRGDPISNALQARFQGQPFDPIKSSLDERFRQIRETKIDAVSDDDITSFSQRLPQVARGMTQSQIARAIRDERRNPGGTIGPRSMTLFEKAKRAVADVTELGSEFVAAGAFETRVLAGEAMVAQAEAAFFDFFDQPDLAEEMRIASQNIREFSAGTELGDIARRRGGAAAKIGDLTGVALPSALAIIGSGGSSLPVLAYFGAQAFGAGAEDYRETMLASGLTPDALDAFTIGMGYAVVEIVSEKIGLDLIGRKLGPKLARSLGDSFMRGKPGKVVNALFQAELITDVNAAEEVLAGFLQDAIAKKGIPGLVDGFDPGRSLSEGRLQEALEGKAVGGLLIGPAALSPARIRERSPKIPTAEQRSLRAQSQPPAQPGESLVAPRPIIPPPDLEPSVDAVSAVQDLDGQQRTTAQEAALDVVADENATDEAKRRATDILDAIDEAGPIEDVEIVPPTDEQKAKFIKRLGISSKRKGKLTDQQAAMLRAEFSSQRRIAQTLVPQIKKKIAGAAKEKAKIDLRTRRLIRRLVRNGVSRKRQGTFLVEVEKATPQQLERILDRIDLAIAQDQVDEQVADAKKLQRRLKTLQNISAATRQSVQESLKTSLELSKQKFTDLETDKAKAKEIRRVAVELDETLDELAEAVADEALDNQAINVAGAETVAKARALTVENIDAPEPTPLPGDKLTNQRGWWRNLTWDIKTLARITENKTKDNESVLEFLMWREMTRADDDRLLQIRQRQIELEAAARQSGFESLADLETKISGKGGEGVTVTVDVEIDGKSVSIPMGQAMWFVAVDGETMAILEAGATVTTRVGRRQEGSPISAEEIQAIQEKVPQELKDFVLRAKEIASQDVQAMLDVMLQLNGRESRRVDKYFRRRRALEATDKAGLPKTQRDIRVKYNENMNLGKERTSDLKAPIIVEDFMSAIVGQINDTAAITHLAIPVRNASGVLLSPKVQGAIIRKWGEPMLDALVDHLGSASLARSGIGTFERLISGLNQNLAVAKLGLNPSSLLRQLGGIPRLGAIMDARAFQDGIAGWTSVDMQEMAENSGFFWDRYLSNPASRQSITDLEQGSSIASGSLAMGLDRMLQNLAAGDIAAAYAAARELNLSTLQLLNIFDAVNAKMAWAGFKAKVRREHPDWNESKQLKWAGEKAADAIRETQNSSSRLDLSTAAIKAKGTVGAFFLLFSSDRMKTTNRLRRAWREGEGQFMRVATAEAINIIWSVTVGRGTTLATALLTAFMVGGPEDRKAAFARAFALDTLSLQLASEFLSAAEPLATARLFDALRFHKADLFETAATATIGDFASASLDTLQAPFADDEPGLKFMRGLLEVGVEGSALLGLNPAEAQMQRFLTQFDKLDDNDKQRKLVP